MTIHKDINDLLDKLSNDLLLIIVKLKEKLFKLRTGKVHPSLIENIIVHCQDITSELYQMATIMIKNSSTLTIIPWNINFSKFIELELKKMNLNCYKQNNQIHVSFPQINEERKYQLIKILKEEGEKNKINIRLLRREALSKTKKLLSSENDQNFFSSKIEKLITNKIDELNNIIDIKYKQLNQQ
jgi:ribosome recycling factor